MDESRVISLLRRRRQDRVDELARAKIRVEELERSVRELSDLMREIESETQAEPIETTGSGLVDARPASDTHRRLPKLRDEFRYMTAREAVRRAVERFEVPFTIDEVTRVIFDVDDNEDDDGLTSRKHLVNNALSRLARTSGVLRRRSKGVYERSVEGGVNATKSETAAF